jgi:hypothetical protein
MKKPTLDILDAISPVYDQYQNIQPINARLNEYTSTFFLDNISWEFYYNNLSSIHFTWQELKYSDVVNKKVKIDNVVPNSIGVYLFIVKPKNLIFDVPKYVFYVGIAGAMSSNRHLNERLKDYFADSQLKKRDAVRILIFKHYENVYIAYTPLKLTGTITLEQIETSLIGYYGTHILANKDDIPVGLKPQSKAFNI